MNLDLNGTIVIGLVGGTATGKTSILHDLKDQFADNQIAILSVDHYYKPLSKQVKDENGIVNFDLPEAIDFTRLIMDIKRLKKGKPIELIEYTFNTPDIFPKHIRIEPTQILLVEGLLILANPELQKIFDHTIMLHSEDTIAFKRRLRRDVMDRAMSKEEVEYQWINHVLPAQRKFVDPHMESVDLLVKNNGSLDHASSQISTYLSDISHRLNQTKF